MFPPTPLLLLLLLRTIVVVPLLSCTAAQNQQPLPAWHRFATNVNYRLTALIDVNGGAPNSHPQPPPNNVLDDHAQTTPGYTIPIDVLTLYDADAETYYQRVSYYSDTTVEYNMDGRGYNVVPKPYGHELGGEGTNVCLYQGGNETRKQPFLNFFPTVEQMENYTVGGLITTEAGIPYRVATLNAPHGTHDAISSGSSQEPHDYETGMPPIDWFELLYQESLSSGAIDGGSSKDARPLKWTMLARNQIINAHTEHWVLRYLNYEAIDSEEETKLWNEWLQLNFNRDCSEDNSVTLSENHSLKTNRLGMFLSSSFGQGPPRKKTSNPSPFDTFLMLHNKQYSTEYEYDYRKSIHDCNMDKIQQWNQVHAGRTSFAHNEFMDLELDEVMKFRGGHIPNPHLNQARKAAGIQKSKSRSSNLRRLSADDEEAIENYNFNVYQVPVDFDPSTLPTEFDWRTHMPGSVSPIKDQGVCGSLSVAVLHAFKTHFRDLTHSVHSATTNAAAGPSPSSPLSNPTGQSSVAAVTVLKRFGGMVPTHNVYGSYLSIDGQCYVDILAGLGMVHGHSNVRSLTQPESSPSTSTVRLVDWMILPERDEVAIKHALIHRGPLSVAFNVVDESLYYANGVLDVQSCTANDEDHLDHAVNLIGWGVDTLEDGTEAQHWILRNSWSTVWGDGGYFRVRMGERDCGVSTSAGFPVVEQVGRETAVA
ncbi:hypothetical protein HJC23_011921 [Cyclotella cryptica]|uniref:Peptidase C1A papain C-terminal domain-containing protein n=1 Tax=Cyclotella cryptica TaxID=29204 RepID=A0ABD3NLU4_9STRA